MQVKKINGMNTIILNEGEIVNITNNKNKQTIIVNSNEENIIVQNYLELKSKNICENWLELFKKTMKLGYNIVTSRYGEDNKLFLRIKFNTTMKRRIKMSIIYNIKVELVKRSDCVNGFNEIIDTYLCTYDLPEDVYKYLFISIFEFIIKQYVNTNEWRVWEESWDILEMLNSYPVIEIDYPNLTSEFRELLQNIITNLKNNNDIKNIIDFNKYTCDLKKDNENNIGIDLNSDLEGLKRLSDLYENSQKEKTRVYK